MNSSNISCYFYPYMTSCLKKIDEKLGINDLLIHQLAQC